MSRNHGKNLSHMFSIELKSKDFVKSLALPNDTEDKVLIEGFLGELKELGVTEGLMLEIKGINGVLRMDLKEEELRKLLNPRTKKLESTSQGSVSRFE
ncbi:MAG TPA: hypothetical protein VK487_04270 [Candidatus Bathyarchaeia archaeon]|nr:hypothetical protein [Candidatus Bathyarchaeia archaeon]